MRYSLLCEGLLEGLWHFVFHSKLWKHCRPLERSAAAFLLGRPSSSSVTR